MSILHDHAKRERSQVKPNDAPVAPEHRSHRVRNTVAAVGAVAVVSGVAGVAIASGHPNKSKSSVSSEQGPQATPEKVARAFWQDIVDNNTAAAWSLTDDSFKKFTTYDSSDPSRTTFTSEIARIHPYFQTGDVPTLESSTPAKVSPTDYPALVGVPVQQETFLTLGTDSNYLVTIQTAQEGNSWWVVNYRTAPTSETH